MCLFFIIQDDFYKTLAENLRCLFFSPQFDVFKIVWRSFEDVGVWKWTRTTFAVCEPMEGHLGDAVVVNEGRSNNEHVEDLKIKLNLWSKIRSWVRASKRERRNVNNADEKVVRGLCLMNIGDVIFSPYFEYRGCLIKFWCSLSLLLFRCSELDQ